MAGCSGGNPGFPKPKATGRQPTGSSPSKTGNAGGLPHDGAPKVQRPVDVAIFKLQPCAVLTPAQLKTLGITVQGKSTLDAAAGPSCDWVNGPGAISLGVSISNGNQGLSGAYLANKKHGYYRKFQPTTINGLPAVELLSSTDNPEADCGYNIGTSDSEVVIMGVSNDKGGNPCADARNVARGVTKTIKSGGS
ncbi:MAG: DUF3558 domain-containing protein [Sciscionella sp.]